jgi:hypothetical protein
MVWKAGEREKLILLFFFMQVKIPKLCLPRNIDEDTIE